jgi:hypothetical protein
MLIPNVVVPAAATTIRLDWNASEKSPAIGAAAVVATPGRPEMVVDPSERTKPGVVVVVDGAGCVVVAWSAGAAPVPLVVGPSIGGRVSPVSVPLYASSITRVKVLVARLGPFVAANVIR